jgi:putative transposase
MTIINSFPKIVKDILSPLPKNDYPVLNSRLFVECRLAYALDNSLTSMRADGATKQAENETV